MRGAVSCPGGFRPTYHHGVLGAGWRRASRLAGRIEADVLRGSAQGASGPLDSGEKSAIVKPVDLNVPPDQPPSSPDSPASVDLRLGLSALGITSEAFAFPAFQTAAQPSVTSPGCGVTPSGLTY
jgi:hypothetical protein